MSAEAEIKVPYGLDREAFRQWFHGEALRAADTLYTSRRNPVDWQYSVVCISEDYADAIRPRETSEGDTNPEWKKVRDAFTLAIEQATEWKQSEGHIL
jgi:hypothetical protein